MTKIIKKKMKDSMAEAIDHMATVLDNYRLNCKRIEIRIYKNFPWRETLSIEIDFKSNEVVKNETDNT